jgi:hypothetical protein
MHNNHDFLMGMAAARNTGPIVLFALMFLGIFVLHLANEYDFWEREKSTMIESNRGLSPGVENQSKAPAVASSNRRNHR